MQRSIQQCYEILYAIKFDNLEEIDRFLEIYNVFRLNHEELENLRRSINGKEIETLIENLSKTKSLGTDIFTSALCKTVAEGHGPREAGQEGLILILLKLFQKFKEEVILPHFMRSTLF